MATKGFRVRLDDGSEMDLDSDMLRSWYEQGLIRGDTPIRPPGTKSWQRLAQAEDLRYWNAPSERSRGPGGEGEEEGAAAHGPQVWRSYVASALLFLGAAAAAYWAFYPEHWTSAFGPVPWREVALGELVLALCLVRGWGFGRAFVRIVMLVAAFALFPLAGLVIAQGVRGLPLLVLLSAWVVASGFFAFLGSAMATSSAILCLATIVLGGAGIYYFGYAPAGMAAPAPASVQASSPAPAAAPPRAPATAAAPAAASPAGPAPATGRAGPPTTSAAAPTPPPAGQAQAVRAAAEEVPLLSAHAVELLMSRSAAQVLDPPEVFRRSYGLVGRGLWALDRGESKEIGDLHSLIYASLPPPERARLGDYIDRARSRYATTPDEDRQMSQVMKSAVLALPADKRARLQVLFEKAMTAGLGRP
ncbi:MAG: hypothetical protein DMF80_16610 [Acidobacteria bacterium]|nr:MAG: hypothetical protein DMF80_16610 [Acidobacteriota bacterium]